MGLLGRIVSGATYGIVGNGGNRQPDAVPVEDSLASAEGANATADANLQQFLREMQARQQRGAQDPWGVLPGFKGGGGQFDWRQARSQAVDQLLAELDAKKGVQAARLAYNALAPEGSQVSDRPITQAADYIAGWFR